MKNQRSKWLLGGMLVMAMWNCKSPEAEPTPYESGAFIINSGNIADKNGTISFLSRTSATPSLDIFNTTNARALAGKVQDYTEVDGKGLVLVDNNAVGEDRVEIVEVETFKSMTTLASPEIENPRRVVNVGFNKAYVSCWDTTGNATNSFLKPGYILLVNTASRTAVKKIPAIKGVERMVVVGSEVFAGSTPSSGDNTLLVINLDTDEVKERIDFGSTPEPIALDADGRLWIQTGRDLVQFNPTSRAIEKRLTFPEVPGSVMLGADRRTFYYTMSGRTYAILTNSTTSIGRVFAARSFNALGVDPRTRRIYGSVVPSLTQAGYVLRYEDTGALIDSIGAEIAPSGFYFR
ncbi:YncE family protein [Spirosoma soli]|uniref:YncE family protein n=1 Tax=Spirosoma soli TaxID=1770529 RepID=A0ABW5M435_9BACT